MSSSHRTTVLVSGWLMAFAGAGGLAFLGWHTAGPVWACGGAGLGALPGLALVYTYFQIPLMVIVFLPALDGIRPQWREATASLGGSTW